MTHALLSPLKNSQPFTNIIEHLNSVPAPTIWANGVVDAQKWHYTAGILAETNRPALIIAPSELKAKAIFEDIYYFFRENCHSYPSRDLIFYAADVKSVDITRQRLQVLDRLSLCSPAENPSAAVSQQYSISQANPIIILSAEALLDRMTPPAIFHSYRFTLAVGDIYEPDAAVRKLSQMGYERRGLAEAPGQFALRGGILDICPAVGHCGAMGETELAEGHALRVEFFGDDVDSIRIIDALNQRSIENAQSFEIYPMRELVFDSKTRKAALASIKEATATQHELFIKQDLRKEAKTLKETMEQAMFRLEDGTGADAFLPFFYQEECDLLDYLPQNTILFLDDPNAIATHMETLQAEYDESIDHRLTAGRILPLQAHVLIPWPQVLHKTSKFSRVLYSSLAPGGGQFRLQADGAIRYVSQPGAVPDTGATAMFEVSVNARSCTPLLQKPAELKQALAGWLKSDHIVTILAGSRRQGQALTDAITDMGLLARFTENLNDVNLATGLVTVARGSLSSGFEYPEIKLVTVTAKELFTAEKSKRRKTRKNKNAEKINHFSDLRVGDYIVHDNHGIGIFRGIEQITSDGLSRDYLKLEYKDGGNIYVQTAQMDMIQKYIGGREEARLSKLGGTDWAKAKAKARQAVEIMAQDLINLYAKRQAAIAHSYGQDTVWQTEFEANFPYTETDDQLTAISDVKRDMESTRVMDRLICGDVGYGKTEIAIRAAFKAVQEGKQVAYLVPTTILAQQHYLTFLRRMKDYPIGVERLSRFQTKKEQQQAIKNLETGKSDIVIGTHRLLSKDVAFKDLGLIIVDEEQRFGVGHKEKLKTMRENVDVLTLTATPIPRTLHFSLAGIRDMSILDEPPEERQPVQTYVMEYNQEFVRDAINRELARGGQVYYLHNRVRNIAEEAMRVQNLVPGARVSFAHGQMSETELENIMHDFVEGDIDVLVCTTIIETGLDISNVNTIVIQNADFMGLSQLYQLRGRVGRSSRLAYAYLMYRRDKVLNEEAEKRLQTIREFTEFGAGFKIAMRDLEIRGAGNLLGQAQHGHMDSVGYDMYCKLLAEAVNQLKGVPVETAQEVTIDIGVDAFIPARFIQDEQQKLELYKKISQITGPQDYSDVQDEIEDRFGNIPQPVTNLLDVAAMKAEARKLGVTSINQKGLNIVLTFRPDAPIQPENLTRLITLNPARLLFTTGSAPHITIRAYKGEKPPEDGGIARIKEIRQLLKGLAGEA